MTTSTRAIPIIILAPLFVVAACDDDAAVADPAAATGSPSVEVEYHSSRVIDGLPYHFIEGVMTGTVERGDGTTGSYEVPIRLAYPESGGNGVAIVEPAMTPFFWDEVWTNDAGLAHDCGRGINPTLCEDGVTEGRLLENMIPTYMDRIAGSHLFSEGYVVMDVQWDKTVTEQMGAETPDGTQRRRLAYGTIEEGRDRWDIISDASLWLRDPAAFTGHGAPGLEAQDYVIGHGLSATGAFWRTFVFQGLNEASDGRPIYDGFLLLGSTAFCFIEGEDPPNYVAGLEPCPGGPPAGEAKVLKLEPESEYQYLLAALTRDPGNENPNQVTWDLPGVSHLSPTMFDMTGRGAVRQNPADWNPVVRAGIHHLTNWVVDGTEPPPTRYMAGDFDEETFEWTTARDEDGNALEGGVRLPHMPRTLDDGTVTGAPVGVYNGVDPDFAAGPEENITIAVSGTFERFSDERLAELYPSRDVYVERYVAALDELLADGYILEADYDRMRARAEGIRIPGPPAGPEAAIPSELDATTREVLDLPRGGEVRLELVHTSTWGPEVRSHAWFASNGDTETGPWPGLLEASGVEGEVVCRDLRDDPLPAPSEMEGLAYKDVGEVITFAADGAEFVLNRRSSTQDDVAYHWHDILYKDHLNPAKVTPGTDYDVLLSGSPDVAETTHAAALHVPADFQPQFPNMNELVIMPANEDFRFISGGASDDPHDLAFVAFVDAHGAVGLCAGPQKGHITIPQAFLETMPTGGAVQYGHLNRQIEEREGRRIDFIGVNTHQAEYLIDNEYLTNMNPG